MIRLQAHRRVLPEPGKILKAIRYCQCQRPLIVVLQLWLDLKGGFEDETLIDDIANTMHVGLSLSIEIQNQDKMSHTSEWPLCWNLYLTTDMLVSLVYERPETNSAN